MLDATVLLPLPRKPTTRTTLFCMDSTPSERVGRRRRREGSCSSKPSRTPAEIENRKPYYEPPKPGLPALSFSRRIERAARVAHTLGIGMVRHVEFLRKKVVAPRGSRDHLDVRIGATVAKNPDLLARCAR